MDVTEARIREFVLEEGAWHRERDELTDEAPLLTGVLNSIAIVDLVALLESEFGIVVENDDLDPENFSSIHAIAAFVERKRRA
jgi:acyl carrier protein